MTALVRTILAISAAAFAAGVGLVVVGLRPTGPPEPDPAYGTAAVISAGQPRAGEMARPPDEDAVQARPPPPTPSRPPRLALPRSAPVSLDAPTIGVRSNVRSVGLLPDGTIEVPPTGPQPVAGWYRYSASPGEAGAAVVVGHVDSARDGPAVFYRLGDLRPGDPISVRRADGLVVRFRITAVREYSKRDFPSARVYGPTATPELRLITCGGPFDASARSYQDNIVAFAVMAGAAEEGGVHG
jgi:hypothetical protein